MTADDTAKPPNSQSPPVDASLNDQERAVIAALREVAFGEIEVVVHNAKIVQLTRSEKFRFTGR